MTLIQSPITVNNNNLHIFIYIFRALSEDGCYFAHLQVGGCEQLHLEIG